MSAVISQTELRRLVDGWIAQGMSVAGPRQVKPEHVLYTLLNESGQLIMDGFVRPANSIKEFIFPRHEKLFGYRLNNKEIELTEVDLPTRPQVVLAARPCDAAALPILDPLFNWDYKDDFYNRRRELTTVVTLACNSHDAHCFCTAVGLAPDAERGSDAMLFDLGDGAYEVRCLTDKGRKLFEGKTQSSNKTGQAKAAPTKTIDLERIKSFINGNFESPYWQELTLRCLGCGSCAFTCPTCHCFDIVDEGNAAGGERVRNWDACQFCLFTKHASGHNPRTVQGQRQRQRVLHKFSMYPDKFGEILCTGCGNCTRHCPVSLGIFSVLDSIQKLEKTGAVEAA